MMICSICAPVNSTSTGRVVNLSHSCCDRGSFYTIDVCLASPGKDFEGGQLATPRLRVDGDARSEDLGPRPVRADVASHPVSSSATEFDLVDNFEKGDAAIFLSHKYHNVMPVVSGKRMVLVAELWEGPEKHCPHRCLSVSDCGHTLGKAHMDSSRQHLAILG